MKNATVSERDLVVDILSRAFDTNQSVNYIVKQDFRRPRRIRALMAYAYDLCSLFGKVVISEDRQACALLLFPEKKKTTLKSLVLDFKLIVTCIGISQVIRVLRREAMLRKARPRERMYYLWFIGVAPARQHDGSGSRLLESILRDSRRDQRPVYLETSTLRNLPWYGKFGFEAYHEIDMGYRLSFLRRPVRN